MESVRTLSDALLGLSATKAEQLSMLQVCSRAVVVYLVLIGYVRFAKKRFLSEATGFDAILVIVIGSIASRAISGTAPFFSSLAGTFVLILSTGSFRTSPGTLPFSATSPKAPTRSWSARARSTARLWQHHTCPMMISPRTYARKGSRPRSR